jgi:hypothetical protein
MTFRDSNERIVQLSGSFCVLGRFASRTFEEPTMKLALVAFTAFMLAGTSGVPSANAEQVPPGPYQQSCRDITIDHGLLTGVCRRPDGNWEKSTLAEAHRCTGQIINNNGALACNSGPAAGASGGRVEQTPQQQLQQRCAAMTDLIARERCLNGL